MEPKYITYSDLNQVRISLKMILSNYAWFNSIVFASKYDNALVVNVDYLDSKIKEVVPPFYKDIVIHIHKVN